MVQHYGSGSLILEEATFKAAKYLHQYRFPFFSSLLFGFLAYGYTFANKLVNHDEVGSLFTKGATVTSGRWGLGALDSIFPNYSMPWIYGILTIVLIAAAVCLLVGMFSIKNTLLQVLTAGCVVVFPSLIGLFGYMFTSASFALSFFLAVLAAALIKDLNKWYVLPALACLILSLSIYQSYVSITAGLLVLILVQQLLLGNQPLVILRRGVCFVLFLIASLGFYYLGTQVVLRLTGTELNSYASEKLSISLSSIASGAVLAYSNFIRFFTEGFQGMIPTAFSRLLHVLLGITVLALLLLILHAKKITPCQIAFLVLLIVLLPLANNCMYMITTPESIHTLVLYSFVSLYLLAVVLADLALSEAHQIPIGRIPLNILTILMALIVIINTYLANQASLHLQLRYENSYAFYTSLFADIKMNPGFDENTKLAIIGEYQQPEFYTEQFEHIHTITGVYGFVPDNYSWNFFLEYYIGFQIPIASPEEILEIQKSSEYQAMAVYPYYGSLQKIGDILVVKLS